MLGEEVGADGLALAGAVAGGAGRLEDAVRGDAAVPGGAEGVRGVAGEEAGGVGDEGVEVEGPRELAQDGVEHVGLRGRGLEELGAAAEDDAREEVDGEDGLAREQGVEEARDLAEGAHVVGIHGEGAREGEEGLGLGQVRPEGRVGGAQDGGDEAELGDGGLHVREHEVADAEGGEPGDGGGAQGGRQDEEEDLGDVVVALEVVEVGVAAQYGEDDVGEGRLEPIALLVGCVCSSVSLGSQR